MNMCVFGYVALFTRIDDFGKKNKKQMNRTEKLK